MLTGERRGVSTRRGMTVLGKIPAVPKPINLPSQRLENRGLDPNVDLVRRGSVSWGGAGRSPPTSSNPWGSSTQASSPPVGNGPSGPKPGLPPGSSGAPWAANASRPSSAGSGTRPSSAGSIGQTQEALAASNAWGPATGRPSSASGVLGQAQLHPPVPRPRSAETTLGGPPTLTRFADHPSGPLSPATPAWGGAGTARKLSEDSHSLHQPARFTLTRVDFPTLGSEKNPDLRPQQNKSGGSPAERPGSADGKGLPPEERPPPGPGGPYDEMPSTGPGVYGAQDRMPEGWRRDAGPYGGHPGMGDGSWHRDGPPPPMQQHGGGQHQTDTWRREPGHGAASGGGPSDDNWRRVGPPVGPYGPPGPGRFQHEGFIHQQRYGPGPGPGPYGRGGGPGPGPGGFGRHGEIYGNAGPFARAGGAPPRPGPPMGPGMFQGPGPYDNYYGPPGVPGPGYGNMDEREMMMLGMGGGPPGMYGNFPQGPPEPFGRFPHGGPGPGPRHMQQNNAGMMRDRNEGMGHEGEGYRENLKYKESSNFKDGGGFKDGGFPKERPASAGEVRRGHIMSSGTGSGGTGTEMPRPLSARGIYHGGHRDWGAAASSDEPMDWTKPVFEEDISSASPGLSKQSSSVSRSEIDVSATGDDINSSDQARRRDPSQEPGASEKKVKGWVGSGEVKEGPVAQVPHAGTVSKSESVQTWRQVDVDSEGSAATSRATDDISLETKDPVARKTVTTEESTIGDKRPMKDSSSSGPPARERSMGREHVYSPQGGRGAASKRESTSSHTSSSAASASRPGQHGFGGVNSRTNLANPARAPSSPLTPETQVVEEVVSPSVVEKHVSSPSSPSGSDGQRNSEKLRILKRVGEDPESPHKDIVNTTEIVHAQLPAAVTTEAKEDVKPKSKFVNSHDGEKEWRPKVPMTDPASETNRSSQSATFKQSTPSSVVPLAGSAPPSGTDVSDKAGPEAEVSADSYDYEAQRARMKEIAAQRAKQLRKEEEERIKEQKAKALAKLEELNRRSSGTSGTQSPTQPVVEVNQETPTVTTPLEETETVPLEDVVKEGTVNESGTTGASTPRVGVRNGRNEHGKRERVIDRKSNGRSREEHRVKVGCEEHRETPKSRLNVSLSQNKIEPPLLPSPSQQSSTPQAVVPPCAVSISNVQQPESQTVGPSEVSLSQAAQLQQQVPPKAQDTRYRGKQFVSQLKQAAKQSQSSGEVELAATQDTVPLSDSTAKAIGWTGGSSLDLDPKEVTLSLGAGHTNSEAGAAALRKKKSKSSGRNKQKLEIAMPLTDSSSAEMNQVWNIGSSTLNECANEAGKAAPHVTTSTGGDESKVASVNISMKESVSQDSKSDVGTAELIKDSGVESGGSDVGSVRYNGDVLVKKSQRKSQPARRVARGDRGGSQDVRVADKPHGGEGMVWAPVRSPSGTHPNGLKGGFGEGSIEAPGEKKDEPPVVQQTSRARRAELERYTPKPVVKQQAQQQEEMQQQAGPLPAQHHAPETPIITVVDDVSQSSESLTEVKFGSEARQAENVSKHGRTHASWRQRGPGNERVSGPKETLQVQHVESADTGAKFQQQNLSHQSQQAHQRNRGVPNTSSEQPRPVNSQHSRPTAAQVSRQQTPPIPADKEQPNVQMNQQGRVAHSSLPQPSPVPFSREYKGPQESVTPYQIHRPGSNQSSRAAEIEGHSSHEHARTQRVNTLQMDRHNVASGKLERDYHTSQERPAAHHQARHSSRHHGGPNSHERDRMQGHSVVVHPQGSTQNVGDVVPPSRERDQPSDPAHGAGQGGSASQVAPGQHVAPVLPERERSPSKIANVQQPPRSPGRQRGRQQAVPHERDQTGSSTHSHHQSRYRQPGHERDHHREVTNAVHHQQQRGASDGHWQQTGVADRLPPSDFAQSYQQSNRASHKSQSVTPTEHEQSPLAHTGSNHYSRSEASHKPHGPAPGDGHKHAHYQPVPQSSAQHQKPQQQGVPQGPRSDNVHNNSHWNGERGGGSPFRGRDHGHRGRGRFGSRASGTGGRNAEIDSRRDQSAKQKTAMDAAGTAVTSQVGG